MIMRMIFINKLTDDFKQKCLDDIIKCLNNVMNDF